MARKHYVEFYSPGTFFHESSRREIESWSIAAACQMAVSIKERYDAKPYGFRFITMIVAEPVPDGEGGMLKVEPKEVAKSPLHYLGGTVKLYHDIADVPENRTLRSNMRCNREPVAIENCNSWRFTGFFGEDELIVEGGKIVRRGDDKDLKTYRKEMRAEFEKKLA